MDESTERLSQTAERIDTAIANGSQWLAGDAISLADLCVLPTIVRMSDIGLDRVWSDLPQMADWYARIRARPSFQIAYYPNARVSVID